jgi:hypothetical protein
MAAQRENFFNREHTLRNLSLVQLAAGADMASPAFHPRRRDAATPVPFP